MGFHFGDYDQFIESMFWYGWIGVQVFFVISGFVIFATARGATGSSFGKARFVRLMPGVWVCATLTMFVNLYILNSSVDSWSYFYIYLKTLVLWPVAPWISGVYWTLIVEISFYSMIFFLLIINLQDRIPRFLMLIGIASACFWGIKMGLAHFGFELPIGMYVQRYLLLQHGCFFALGGLTFRMAFFRVDIFSCLLVLMLFAVCCIEVAFQARTDGATWLAAFVPVILFASAFSALVFLRNASKGVVYSAMDSAIWIGNLSALLNARRCRNSNDPSAATFI